MVQQYATWINDFGDTLICTTVELISLRIKNNKTKDYIHKYNRRRFQEENKFDKSMNITAAESLENVYHVTR